MVASETLSVASSSLDEEASHSSFTSASVASGSASHESDVSAAAGLSAVSVDLSGGDFTSSVGVFSDAASVRIYQQLFGCMGTA